MTDAGADWRAVLAGRDADAARTVAHQVGCRLRDAHLPSPSSEYERWRPAELARGHPGFAVAFSQLDACFPGEGWGAEATAQLGRAVDSLRRDRTAQTGLISGLAGLAFAADLVGRQANAQLLSTLDGLIRRRTEPILRRADGTRTGVAEHDVDVVSGLAGIGAYFLTRADRAALGPILERLAALLGRGGAVPAWYSPVELLPEDDRADFPLGRMNCGLAHGVPGPLALLALATTVGADAVGLLDAIEQASSWLVDRAVEDEWGINWPAFVRVGADRPEPPARAAWCYGAPGVARALWLAGAALEDTCLRDVGVAALEAVHRRPPEARHIDAPTFCHGRAGLLQITLRMANATGSPTLRAAGEELAHELAREFRPDWILGYRDLDPAARPVDQAGLLHGAAGIALVLLAAATHVPPRWDRLFLLS